MSDGSWSLIESNNTALSPSSKFFLKKKHQKVFFYTTFLWLTFPKIANDMLFYELDILPALNDGEHWVSGFSNIAKYIKNKSRGRLDLDDSLSSQEIAQSIAYDFFLQHQIADTKYTVFLPFFLKLTCLSKR